MRPEEHNAKVLEQVKAEKFDCCTSISVLNVIDIEAARSAHISLCFNVLKEDGSAFFKVWPGNGTGVGVKGPNSYQSNKSAKHYVDEIKKIFGNENVSLADENTIKAVKKIEKIEQKRI